ncbi:hypothetical protein COV06_01555 [Candidatus Uhrbacteria bacterium CG10_big_fil_rev_8_21_14_0_10_50_16]|uniref:HTH arsR-type domain-containing protein n=1 Tax=Candidatus Uhrbacteria bacterium CG10_big_fil_rev_8_21_14_0_10_50_16 TaxID=1975039 RepID=A0A2H0RQN2_9BACT|nr:MAG: hypothetical protein COV06_01555 [Candidatus Uhrbacteria bacterium CG10_big_fil_rev_8_21_14_0_10_50_16]
MKKGSDNERFGIEQLFGSKTRSRLLQLFLKNQDTRFFVRELTRKINAQLNSVRRELNNLVELGVVVEMEDTEDEGKKDRKKYYQVNKNFGLYEELQSLFAKASVLIQQDLVRTLVDEQPIQVLILTGMFTGGTENETDMLIVGSPEQKNLKERIEGFEQELGCEINYTVMPTDEYLYRRDISDRFLMSILDGEFIEIHNTLP